MVDQAKWHCCSFRKESEKARKRAFFYAYVLRHQLKEAGFKRVKMETVYFDNEATYPIVWVFCGYKRMNTVVDEVEIMFWTLKMKGERNG